MFKPRDLYDMKVGDVLEFGSQGYRVIRVPGGWVYHFEDTLNGKPGAAATFVPQPRGT